MFKLAMGIGGALALLAFIRAAVHSSRIKTLQAIKRLPTTPLAGQRCQLFGTVELPKGSEYAVMTMLFREQRGKAGERPRWEDARIERKSQAFWLVLDDDQRVRCELGSHFKLDRAAHIAKLGRTLTIGDGYRKHMYRVGAGVEIEIEGLVQTEAEMREGDYRGGVGEAWVLRASDANRAVVTTTRFAPVAPPSKIEHHGRVSRLLLGIGLSLLAACAVGALAQAGAEGTVTLSPDGVAAACGVVIFILMFTLVLGISLLMEKS